MTCLEFVQSITYENFVDAIVSYFDENMALYNVLKETDNAMAITGIPNNYSIAFVIKFDTKYKNDKLRDITRGRILDIYGRKFIIQCDKRNELESIITLIEKRN